MHLDKQRRCQETKLKIRKKRKFIFEIGLAKVGMLLRCQPTVKAATFLDKYCGNLRFLINRFVVL